MIRRRGYPTLQKSFGRTLMLQISTAAGQSKRIIQVHSQWERAARSQSSLTRCQSVGRLEVEQEKEKKGKMAPSFPSSRAPIRRVQAEPTWLRMASAPSIIPRVPGCVYHATTSTTCLVIFHIQDSRFDSSWRWLNGEVAFSLLCYSLVPKYC